MSRPNHLPSPEKMPTAAAYGSPTFSQIHRESLTSPQRSTSIHPVYYSSTNDLHLYDNIHRDPLDVAAGIWVEVADTPADDKEHFEEGRLDSFPLSLCDHNENWLRDHEYPRLCDTTTPFCIHEGHSPDAMMSSDLTHNMLSDTASTQVASEVTVPPMDVPRDNPEIHGNSQPCGRSPNRLGHHLRYRKPSQIEMDSCNTDRGKKALRVWYKRYNQLVDYQKKNGDCNVPQKYGPNPALGVWVNKMRMQKKLYDDGEHSTCLSETKIIALEAIDFSWGKRKGDFLWEQKYLDLLCYKEKYGNCDVPTKYRADTALGRWVSDQRKAYHEMKANKQSFMTHERVKKLQAAGFQWVASRRKG